MSNKEFKKHVIYKKDKWNMMTVEVQGKTIILREISDQWGEDCHTFIGRPAMFNWVESRFPKSEFVGNEQDWEDIMNAFQEV